MSKKREFTFRGVEFVSREDGNVAMIFGLTFVPIMLMLGATVDYTRFAMTHASLQQATDAAVLAVASKMKNDTTDAQATSQAQVLLRAQPRMASAEVVSATISADKQTFCADSRVTIENAFMQLAQVFTLTPTATACANLAGGVDPNTTYEIALVLDNSGSMSSSAGGVSKMQALRDAATSFTNTMFSKVTSGKLQMSIAPFNAAVIAVDPSVAENRALTWIDTGGNSSLHWNVFGGKTVANTEGFYNRFDIYAQLKKVKSTWDWNGCFEPQPYPMDVNDTPPVPNDPTKYDTLFVPYLSPDEPNNSTNAYLDNYVSDDGGDCKKAVGSDDWAELTNICKYKYVKGEKTYGGKGPDGVCPSAPSQTLMQLTSTQSTVTNKISGLVEGGTTNLHEGFMWGWRTISPNAPYSAGRAYDAANNRKVIIFMTDGFNNWRSDPGGVTGSQYEAPGYYSLDGKPNERLPDGSNGDHVNYQTLLAASAPYNNSDFHPQSRDAQDELTLEACTNAKAKGIEIFTIGFSTPGDPIDQQGLDLMKNCATNADHYFAASDASQLDAAFASIGIGLGKLRLSR